MQLLTYQTNKNTHQIIIIINKQTNKNTHQIIIIINKQTNKNKNKISSSFFNFPNSFSHETISWFERYYNIKKIYLKNLLKTANLRTKHRGNSLTKPSVNGLGETMGRLRK